jgi:hypothetical protein
MSINVIRRIVIAATVVAYTNDLTLENARQNVLHALATSDVDAFFTGWTNRLARMRGAASALVALKVAEERRATDPHSAKFADAILVKLVNADGVPFASAADALANLNVKKSGGPPQSLEAQRLGVASFPDGMSADGDGDAKAAAKREREDAILRMADLGIESSPKYGNVAAQAERIKRDRAKAEKDAAKDAIKS